MNPFENAKPIWSPLGSHPHQVIKFYGSFIVQDPTKCRLFLHVHTTYALYINDQLVYAGAFSDYEDQKVYDVLDLAAYIHPGENAFLLDAYHQGENSFTFMDYPPEVIFSLREGEEELLVSDAGVPCHEDIRFLSPVPRISPQLSFSFGYDLTRPLPPLSLSVICGETPAMEPRPIQKLRIRKETPAILCAAGAVDTFVRETQEDEAARPALQMQRAFRRLERPCPVPLLPCEAGVKIPGNCAILDLGKERVGYLTLDLTLPEGGKVYLGWGEHLEDGYVRTAIGPRNFAGEITMKPGRTRFLYPLKRIGARFLEIHVEREPFILHYAGVRPVYYPVSQLTEYHSVDKLSQRIYQTGVRTLQCSMHEHYEDCPWREQALYTMDSRNQMLAGFYAFQEYPFARASLQLIAKSLREDGLLELISPGRSELTIPSFTAIFLLQVYEYVHYSEDLAFGREVLPVLSRIADGFLKRRDDTGLIPRYPASAPGSEGTMAFHYWNFYEWQDGLDGSSKGIEPPTGDDPVSAVRWKTSLNPYVTDTAASDVYDAPLNAFVMLGLENLSRLYLLLGNPRAASSLRETVFCMRSAFHAAFWDEGAHEYVTYRTGRLGWHRAELTQALALLAEVPEKEEAEKLRARLASSHSPLIPTTLSHSLFKYEALLMERDIYGPAVFQDIGDKYESMLRRGATTFWETLEGADAFDKAGSLCHGWSAIPVYLYLKYIANVKKEGTGIVSLQGLLENPAVTYRKDPGEYIEEFY